MLNKILFNHLDSYLQAQMKVPPFTSLQYLYQRITWSLGKQMVTEIGYSVPSVSPPPVLDWDPAAGIIISLSETEIKGLLLIPHKREFSCTFHLSKPRSKSSSSVFCHPSVCFCWQFPSLLLPGHLFPSASHPQAFSGGVFVFVLCFCFTDISKVGFKAGMKCLPK